MNLPKNTRLNNSFGEFLNKYRNKEKFFFLLAILGVAVFLLIAFTAPFKKKEIAERYKKPPSQAAEPTVEPTEDLLLRKASGWDGNILEEIRKKLFLLREQKNTPEFSSTRGFIVEFKDEPLVKYYKRAQESEKVPGRLRALSTDYTQNLETSHNAAKEDIISRLGGGQFKTLSTQSVVGGDSNRESGVQILGEYKRVFNGLALNITSSQAESVKNSPYVKSVYPDYELQLHLTETAPKIGASEVWRLQDVTGNALTGRGVRVGIIDSGVDYTHPDLNAGNCSKEKFLQKQCSKVVGGWNFCSGNADAVDENGHGTHVASIAAGNGVIKGIAPDASIYSYRIFGKEGGTTASIILSAIEEVVDPNQDGDLSDRLDIVNMSLGGPYGNPDDALAKAVDNISDLGVAVIVSAGNSGPGEITINTPGVSRKAITVGASKKDDTMTNFSSRGPIIAEAGKDFELIKPNVVAPGNLICAARLPSFEPWSQYNPVYQKCVDDFHVMLSGTSMAAPVVTGASALLKQKYPSWGPAEIKSALMATATDLGQTPGAQGSGRIDVLKALQTSTIIQPSSIGFGSVNNNSENWTATQDLTVKNITNNQATYSASLKQPISQASVSFSPETFTLEANQSQQLRVTLAVNNNLSEGVYSNEVLIRHDQNTYRIPIDFFKKNVQVSANPNITNGSFAANVKTPYTSLGRSPNLVVRSPSGVERNIQLFQEVIDRQKWISNPQTVEEPGTHELIANTEQGYTARNTLIVDKTPPSFDVSGSKEGSLINLNLSANEAISPAFTKQFIDAPDSVSTATHWRPDIYVEGDKVYVVYVAYYRRPDNTDGGTLSVQRIEFIKSADGGKTWSAPVTLHVSTEKISLNSGSLELVPLITKFKNKLYVFFQERDGGVGFFSGKVKLSFMVSEDVEGERWSSNIKNISNDLVGASDHRTFKVKPGKEKLHLAYISRVGIKINYLNSLDGTNWGNPTPLPLPETSAEYLLRNMSMEVKEDSVQVVYTRNSNPPPSWCGAFSSGQVGYLRSSDGLNWTNKIIKEKETGFIYPTIVGSGQNVFVAWSSFEGDIYFSKSGDNGDSWVVKERVTKSRDRDIFPSLGFSDSKLYMTWIKNFIFGTLVATSTDLGESWGDIVTLSSFSFPGDAFSGDNKVHFVWGSMDRLGGDGKITYTVSSPIDARVESSGISENISVTGSDKSWSGKAKYRGDGDYVVYMWAKDVAGNLGTSIKNIRINATPAPSSFVCNACSADISGGPDGSKDNKVDIVDFGFHASCRGKSVTEIVGTKECRLADVNGDGVIDDSDFSCIQQAFNQFCPSIDTLEPSLGGIGTEIKIKGAGFGNSKGSSKILFTDNKEAAVTSWSFNEVRVTIPQGTITGKVKVQLSDTNSAQSPIDFAVTQPTIRTQTVVESTPAARPAPQLRVQSVPTNTPRIDSLSRTSAQVGTLVDILGSNFGNGKPTVKVNGQAATPFSWSASKIIIEVPSRATNGLVEVYLSGNQKADNSPNLTILPPTISSFNPSSATKGIRVTVLGSGFGREKGKIIINNTEFTPTNIDVWTLNRVAFNVPNNASTGKIKIKAANGLVSQETTSALTVSKPTLVNRVVNRITNTARSVFSVFRRR